MFCCIYYHRYVEKNVPSHPCLKLCANCEQPLTGRVGRRLITMEKILDYEVNNPFVTDFLVNSVC